LRALSTAQTAFIERVLWKADIEGLLDGCSWEAGEALKAEWRALLIEQLDKAGLDG
jgi:hypothetical protein